MVIRFESEEFAAVFGARRPAEAAYVCSPEPVLLAHAPEDPVAEVQISDGCPVAEVVEWVVSSEASGEVSI